MTRIRRWCCAIALGVLAATIVGGSVVAADASVAIEDFAFAPSTVMVGVGDAVTWTNRDGTAHTATADDGSFDTESLGGGESATLSFAAAGTFAYHCAIHPTMRGTVVVQGAAATAAPPEDGGDGGTTITPAPTDTLPAPAAARDDVTTVVAVLLAILGLSMLVGTYAFGRRPGDGP
jgi:plastocyanin